VCILVIIFGKEQEFRFGWNRVKSGLVYGGDRQGGH
jgi:hypothetical protein